jgi:hypothetical protein
MDCHCPISHIPLSELKMAVVFRGDAKTVYDAEHLVRWLKVYAPRNPVTNRQVNAGARIADVLVPFKLPHMGEHEWHATERFLKRSGRVWWPAASSGYWKDGFGLCMCLVVWVSGFYGLLFVAECSALYPSPNFSCLMAPLVLFLVQLSCIIGMCWTFPEIRAQLAVRQAICLTLGCIACVQILCWLVCRYVTPVELRLGAARLLLRHRGWARFFVHARVMALLEKILIV